MFCKKGSFHRLVVNTDVFDFYKVNGAPAFENSHLFAEECVPPDMDALQFILFDHIKNDWRDVLCHKITRPVLVISGENSNWVESQRWIAETVPHGRIIVYGKDEYGDHFLHLKLPRKFAGQLKAFLSE